MPAPAPELSVLIATHNRRETLRRCLQSLALQTQDPATFEVIVADDGSDDGTATMVEGLSTPPRLRALRLPKRGKSPALNAAIEAAAAPVCLFLDDDVIAAPELVAEHLAAHRDDASSLGVGAITQRPPDGRDWYAAAHARSWNLHYEEFSRREPTWIDCYGANFSAPHRALEEVGGVATDLTVTEDLELSFRLCQAGCRPRFLPAASCVHDDQKRSGPMLKGTFAQGVSHAELARRTPEMAAELLDWHSAGPREISLRRALISIHFPPAPLARLGRLIPGEGRQLLWFSAIRRFAFWRGARQEMTPQEWDRVTGARSEAGETTGAAPSPG